MPSPAQGNSATAQYAQDIKARLAGAWIPTIYCERILKTRTRSYQLGASAKTAGVEIQHTLLGVELKLVRRRLLCPDLATARYLAVFARAGCTAVAIPYDISQTSHLADELDSSWHRMLLMAEQLTANRSPASRARLRRWLISEVRAEISAAGAGAATPTFKQNTKQRGA
jgi:hypothetical protein